MLGWLNKIVSWWHRRSSTALRPTAPLSASSPQVKRIVLADGVARTLFEDYAEHRESPRGGEEIGWILLGLRQEGEAIALAALPAGTQRDAGAAHIRFNSEAQALASRIVRQQDKRLQIIGVVHTHPGKLRWPSDGDFHGDSQWIAGLRGEGVFAIGTADAHANESTGGHVQVFSDMRFSWYALGAGDARYRPLPVHVTIGPDLALPLRPVWNVVEAHAESLNKLCRQFAKVQLEVINEPSPQLHALNGQRTSFLLCVKIALAEPNQQLRLLLSEGHVRYYWDRASELISIDPQEPQVDRAVYLILAELAKDPAVNACERLAPVQM